MRSTFLLRRPLVAGLTLAALAIGLGPIGPASAVEYATAGQVGTIAAPEGMVIATGARFWGLTLKSVRAGGLQVGPSPAAMTDQRIAATATLERYDASVRGWTSTGLQGRVEDRLVDSRSHASLGGARTNAWTFDVSRERVARYRVSYSVIWYAVDEDGDPTNDEILAQAVIRRPGLGDGVCVQSSSPVPCQVTDDGVWI